MIVFFKAATDSISFYLFVFTGIELTWFDGSEIAKKYKIGFSFEANQTQIQWTLKVNAYKPVMMVKYFIEVENKKKTLIYFCLQLFTKFWNIFLCLVGSKNKTFFLRKPISLDISVFIFFSSNGMAYDHDFDLPMQQLSNSNVVFSRNPMF